jgi:hypothetical protein
MEINHQINPTNAKIVCIHRKGWNSKRSVHVFDFSFAEGKVVMTGPKAYMAEPKVHVFDFSLA